MDGRIFPSRLSGTVSVPGSKSLGQRACALALLHKGSTLISNLGNSADERVALNIIRELGAGIEKSGSVVRVRGNGFPLAAGKIYCGESGLSCRLFTCIAALHSSPVLITGSGSLLNRPMGFFENQLPQFGVTVMAGDGFLPLTVTGPILPKDAILPGNESSQYISGLLMAIAKQAKKRVSLTVTNANSKPYLDLTVSMMRKFGYDIVHENHERFIINPVQDFPEQVEINIEGDWSAASFLLVAAAISGSITVKNLQVDSAQADRRIIDVLALAGAGITLSGDELHVLRPEKLRAFEFDATDAPDLFPPLAVLAMYARGTSRIKGIGRLLHKESDRSLAIENMCRQMGIEIVIEHDEMFITGGNVNGALLSSHNDHRMAMAAAVAALNANGSSTVTGIEAVSKSYPSFFETLQNLGARTELSGKLQYE